MSELIVIAHNIRSTHNIGSIFRSCDCFGVSKLILSGYSPYPAIENDTRLPHIQAKVTGRIQKTALGAERTVPFAYSEEVDLDDLKQQGFCIVALEQTDNSIPLHTFKPNSKVALILGEERYGITADILKKVDHVLEIEQHGVKESLNVSVATGIALYQISKSRYTNA